MRNKEGFFISQSSGSDGCNAGLLTCLFCLGFFLTGALPATASAQGANACDQVFSNLPKRTPDRIETGRPCVEQLPNLPVSEQARIAREYARTLPAFIPESEFEDLIAALDPAARLPLEAHFSRYYSHSPDPDTVTKLNDLGTRVTVSNDALARAHYELARGIRIFRLGGDHQEMERRMRVALELARQNDVVGLIPFIHNALAVRAKADGDFVAAVDEYQRALAAFEANDDRASTGIVYANIGNVFSDLGDNLQAIRLYEQAIAIYDEYEPEGSERRVAAKVNRASALSNEGKYEEAVEAFEVVRGENAKVNGNRLTGHINYQNALALYGINRRSDAIAMAETAVPQILEFRDPAEAGAALNWLAARYLEDGKLDDAQSALNRAREIMEPGAEGAAGLLDNPGNTFWALEYAESMGSLLTELGRPEAAAPYFKAALTLSNDRFENEKIEAISNSGLLFELRDRDERIQRMNDRAQISELQLSQSRLQTTLGFALALAIGLVAFLIFRSFTIQKSLAASKDTLISEIHHRTKNNLQLLTSLFNMDARRLVTAEEAHQRQLEAASRARTMAILHDHIYSKASQDEPEVEVKEFFERLLTLLEESFGRKGVTLSRSVQSANMDIGRVTPLGLLISELVTNAYKHAFDENEGHIEFSLVDLGTNIEIEVKDNGVGLPEGISIGDSNGIGMTLIRDLAEQLDSISTVESNSSGTIWTYEIAKKAA